MLDMDLTSKGISWAGNIYQKFETMCQDVYQEVDGIIIQDKAKYVENHVQMGCETVRKFCAEVMQDLFLPSDCTVKTPVSDSVKVPVSDISLNYNADVEICKKTKKGFEKCPLNEKTLPSTESEAVIPYNADVEICKKTKKGFEKRPLDEKTTPPTESEAVIPSGSDLMQAQLNTNLKDANCREECGILSEISVPASSNLKDTEGNHLDAVEVVSDISKSQTACSSVLHPVSTSHKNVMEKRSNQSGHIASADTIGRLNDLDLEEASKNTDDVEASTDIEEEYEDLKLVASSIDPEARDKTHLLAYQDSRRRSYKKKLRDALSLKLRFSKKNDDYCQMATSSGAFNVGIEEEDLSASSSTFLVNLDSRRSLVEDSYESEWELL